MSALGLDPDRSKRIEQALLSELYEVSAWLGDLERRARSMEPVERRMRRLRKLSARLDAQIRLIRELREQGQVGTA
jgi:hypothetical protein